MKTIDCGGCGATLDVSEFEPGTEFSCGGCGGNLKVPARTAAARAAAAPARKGRPARSPKAERESAPAAGAKKKNPLVLAGIGGGVLLLGIVGVVMATKKKPEPPPTPPAETPVLKPKTPAKPDLPPDEAEWAAAKTTAEKDAIAERRTLEARGSDAASKELHRFLVGKGRMDLAKKAALARVAADPESPWGNETLGRVNAKAALEELQSSAAGFELFPPAGWERLKKRMDEKRTWVEADEKRQWEEDLAAARRQVKTIEDPWYKEATQVLTGIRADRAYNPKYGPVDFIALPPYLVMAQHQKDPSRHQTVNVLNNHSKFFRCLTTEFLKIMGEAGLSTPTVAEMGNPVLKAFVFIDRPHFDQWHVDQGSPVGGLSGVRAYYAWGGNQYMMMYDTGAPTALQDDDTCTAFHEATHQLVHYYRRYYLTKKLREKKPEQPDLDLRDMRLHGQAHWFGEGFAEFFGAADRISSQTGEWRLLRPLQNRLLEWGDPIIRKPENQWSLEEVITMKGKMHMEMTARKKWPDRFQEMNSLFYCQAWALNHYLYFGKDGAYRARYLKVVHEEMTCNSGSEMFFRIMEAGEGEARKKWIEELEDEIKDYVRKLYKNLRK
jgi:hypothetical protein